MATELEIMIHAKSYLDKLANGINPLTDETLPETDIVNQVRISRCLFFVSDVLRQVIEKGGLKKAPKPARIPFALTAEQAGKYQPFEEPIHLSAITNRINSLSENESMKKLSYRSIAAFLEIEGLLTTYSDAGDRNKRKPTDAGRALGISVEARTGFQGPYTVLLYNRNAQQYILDHLDRIAEINRMPAKEQAPSYLAEMDQVHPEAGQIIRE